MAGVGGVGEGGAAAEKGFVRAEAVNETASDASTDTSTDTPANAPSRYAGYGSPDTAANTSARRTG
jgi:hypothetical protein